MKVADKLVCQAAAVFLLFALGSAPANAQFGFGGGGGGGGGSDVGGGGQDMMTQMAPMLEMMKARMGKRRFAGLMQTMGPMMGQMMEGGGGGGGFGGMIPGGGGGFGGGDIMGMIGPMMQMAGPMMQMANFGGGHRRHRRHR